MIENISWFSTSVSITRGDVPDGVLTGLRPANVSLLFFTFDGVKGEGGLLIDFETFSPLWIDRLRKVGKLAGFAVFFLLHELFERLPGVFSDDLFIDFFCTMDKTAFNF